MVKQACIDPAAPGDEEAAGKKPNSAHMVKTAKIPCLNFNFTVSFPLLLLKFVSNLLSARRVLKRMNSKIHIARKP